MRRHTQAAISPVQIGDNSYQPSDLSMDTLAVFTLPKDASFADAEKTVVTDLPEDAPQGAWWHCFLTNINDRKIGQVYLISASAAGSGSKRGDGFG